MSVRRLSDNPIHLGIGATAEVEPEIDGVEWYRRYGERHAEDGTEARLVSQFAFDADWDVWEMHPAGAEVVLCIRGGMALIRELPDGRTESLVLAPGEYAINPPGVWHTADVAGVQGAEAIFITAGSGTEHRPRSAG